jgi:hypothetical protein
MSDDRPRPTFSANELRESLGIPECIADPDALTIPEIAEEAGIAEMTARRYVRLRVEDGSWICVGRVMRTSANGVAFYAEGYKRAK